MPDKDLTYLEHILICIDKINHYSKSLSKEDFLNNELVQDAVFRNLEVIGEASKKISLDTKNKFDNIPWKEIAGIRDKLIHDYIGVDKEIIWETLQKDIPYLEEKIHKFLKE